MFKWFGERSEKRSVKEIQTEERLPYEATIKILNAEYVTAKLVAVSAMFDNLYNLTEKKPEAARPFNSSILLTREELDNFGGVGNAGKLLLDVIPVPDIEELNDFLDRKKSTDNKIYVSAGAKSELESPENDDDHKLEKAE